MIAHAPCTLGRLDRQKNSNPTLHVVRRSWHPCTRVPARAREYVQTAPAPRAGQHPNAASPLAPCAGGLRLGCLQRVRALWPVGLAVASGGWPLSLSVGAARRPLPYSLVVASHLRRASGASTRLGAHGAPAGRRPQLGCPRCLCSRLRSPPFFLLFSPRCRFCCPSAVGAS